jgi:hypothetical protein
LKPFSPSITDLPEAAFIFPLITGTPGLRAQLEQHPKENSKLITVNIALRIEFGPASLLEENRGIIMKSPFHNV